MRYNYNNFYPFYNNYQGMPNMNSFRGYQSMPMYGNTASNMRSGGGILSKLSSLFVPASTTSSIASGVAGASNVASSGITFSGILNGASKTLGVINQAIPIFYQIKPIWNNAKTMLRVAKAMTSSSSDAVAVNSSNNANTDTNNTNESTNKISPDNYKESFKNDNEPTFFN